MKYLIKYTDSTGSYTRIVEGETIEECRSKAFDIINRTNITSCSDELIEEKKKNKNGNIKSIYRNNKCR